MKAFFFIILTVLLSSNLIVGQDSMNYTIPIEIRAESQGLSLDTILISRAQFLTYPASFDDPSRLLLKHAGFSTQNDQANFIIRDGLPAHYIKWSLYGAEILNPNHLSSAGTITGRNSNSAGGVNMLSGQVLKNLTFQTNGHQALSSVSGLADLSLRTPYDNRYHTNLSLIGLETGIDRSSADGKNDFLLNYRYSTVGLLAGLGIDFGDEEITYQDVTAKWHYKRNAQQSFTMYFIGGKDSNNHPPLQDSLVEEYIDRQNIELASTQLITGVHFKEDKNDLQKRFTLNFSFNRLKGLKSMLSDSRSFIRDDLLVSAYSEISKKWNSFIFRSGGTTSYRRFGDVDRTGFYSAAPILGFDYNTSSKWTIRATLKAELNTLSTNLSMNLQPAISIDKAIGPGNIAFTYQRISQMQSLALMIDNNYGFIQQGGRRNLEYIVSDQLEINWSSSHFGIRLFYKYLDQIPGIQNDIYVFSDLANQDYLPGPSLANIGKAEIIGFGLTSNFSLMGFRIAANVTLSEARQSIGRLQDIHMPYDFGHTSNVLLSRTFQISNRKYILLSLSSHFRGGVWESLVTENTGDPINPTGYLASMPYSNQLKSFFRSDLRINYVVKSVDSRYKSVVSLDIQNVTNRQNDAFHYYDPLLDEVKLQKQLGLIPILGWRIEF